MYDKSQTKDRIVEKGSCYAVPLSDKGYGLVTVAIATRDGRSFGYFFGPRRLTPPSIEQIGRLEAKDAILLCRFGLLGVLNGSWPHIGQLPSWNSTDWPLPPFIRCDSVSGRKMKVIYNADLQIVSEVPLEAADYREYPQEALFGYKAVEAVLDKLLAES